MTWACWLNTTVRAATTLRLPQRQTQQHTQPCGTSSRCRRSRRRPPQQHRSRSCQNTTSRRQGMQHRMRSAHVRPPAPSSRGRCMKSRGCRWMPLQPAAVSRPVRLWTTCCRRQRPAPSPSAAGPAWQRRWGWARRAAPCCHRQKWRWPSQVGKACKLQQQGGWWAVCLAPGEA